MLVGQGAKGATDEVIEVADLLGAGVAKALNGRAALPDDLPFVTGSIGLLGHQAVRRHDGGLRHAAHGRHVVPLLGVAARARPGARACRSTSTPASSASATRSRCRWPATRAETLRALRAAAAAQGGPRPGARRSRRASSAGGGSSTSAPTSRPTRSTRSSSSTSSRSGCPTARSCSPTRARRRTGARATCACARGMDAALSGTLATMCPAVPYALAAKFAFPQRPVIACLGDGAMQMLGINGLIDLAHYQRPLDAARCVVLVLNNGDLNQVTWEQRVLAGDAKLRGHAGPAAVRLRRLRAPARPGGHPRRAPGGGRRRRGTARSPPDARSSLDVVTDPEVPPLPPHIRMEHAQGLRARAAARRPRQRATSSASRCARSSRIS